MSQELEKTLVFTAAALFAGSMSYGSQILHAGTIEKCAAVVARYVVYLLLIRGAHAVFTAGNRWVEKKRAPRWSELSRAHLVIFSIALCAAGCLQRSGADTPGEEFVCLLIATLVIRYIDMGHTADISYGVGMACSFMEGYLEHVLPSDGASCGGLDLNVRRYEGRHGVTFPARRLLLVVTRSLYCPPDLKEFNSSDPDRSYVEACEPLGEVEKDVAGVKRRVYRNAVYKLHRGRAPRVYVAAECATPLHTLHRVLQKRAVYDDLLKSIDPERVGEDFCGALQAALDRSPACRGRCELVYFDDTDPTQNLADVLLDAVRRIEPNFENICRRAANQ